MSGWVWGLLLASSALYFFSGNEADNDLWGHVLFGREMLATGVLQRIDTHSYTAAGQPWVNHEWLAQGVMGAVYEWGGTPALAVMKLAVALAMGGLLFAMVRRRTRTPAVWGAVGVLAIAVLARGISFRPQIFTYLGVALTLWLIDRVRDRRPGLLWLFPLLVVVWTNVHGGVVLGVAILGLFVAAECLQSRRIPGALALVGVLSVGAIAINPYGPRLVLYIWAEVTRPHPITEWQPVAFGDPAQVPFLAMAGLFVLTLPFFPDWRRQGWQPILGLLTAVLAFRQQRHTAVFAVCAVVPLAAQVDEMARWLALRSTWTLSAPSQRLLAVGVAAIAAMQLAFTGLRWQRDGGRIVFDPSEYPTGAVQALRQSGVRVNLVVPLDWGAYVLWHLAPNVKVSLDGRFATVFSDELVALNFSFFTGGTGWRRLIEDYPTDAVLLPAGSPAPVVRVPGWRRIYGDAVADVYARSERADLAALPVVPEPAARFFP